MGGGGRFGLHSKPKEGVVKLETHPSEPTARTGDLELAMVVDMAQRFARKELTLPPEVCPEENFLAQRAGRAAKEGLLACGVPEDLGGAAMDLHSQAVLLMKLAAGSAGFATALATHLTAVDLLVWSGGPARTLLTAAIQDGRLVGLAVPEWTSSSSGLALLCPLDPACCDLTVALLGRGEETSVAAFAKPA